MKTNQKISLLKKALMIRTTPKAKARIDRCFGFRVRNSFLKTPLDLSVNMTTNVPEAIHRIETR